MSVGATLDTSALSTVRSRSCLHLRRVRRDMSRLFHERHLQNCRSRIRAHGCQRTQFTFLRLLRPDLRLRPACPIDPQVLGRSHARPHVAFKPPSSREGPAVLKPRALVLLAQRFRLLCIPFL